MNHDKLEKQAWDRAAALRRAVLHVEPEEDCVPPPGFTTGIVARWAELRRNERVCFWARWSLRGAITGVAAACLVLVFLPSEGNQESGPLLTAPGIEIPGVNHF